VISEMIMQTVCRNSSIVSELSITIVNNALQVTILNSMGVTGKFRDKVMLLCRFNELQNMLIKVMIY